MERREQRTVAGGALVIAVALLLAFIVFPFARRWQLREVELDTTRAAIADLEQLVRDRRALDSAATATENVLASRGRRVIHARSATLAASAMQSFLQDASDASRLVVTRLDVAQTEASGATTLPATLTAHTDIHGLAELLGHLEQGPRVVRVERMTVQMNSALRGAPDMLQLALTLRAPILLDGGAGAPLPSPRLSLQRVNTGEITSGGAQAASITDSAPGRIVAGNVFSARRRAPSSRFSPPGTSAGSYDAAVGDGPAMTAGGMYGDNALVASVPAAGTDGESVPHLYGIVDSDGVRQALVALRAGEPPRLVAVGDRQAGYRVTAIGQDRVVLAFAGGVRTLRLTRPASRDSLENSP